MRKTFALSFISVIILSMGFAYFFLATPIGKDLLGTKTSQTTLAPVSYGSANAVMAKGMVGLARPTAQMAKDNRQIIRTANINLLVDNTQVALTKLEHLALQLKGYVQNSSISGYESGTRNGTTVLAIPDESFLDALTKIKILGTQVESEQISREDVTANYTDLKTRLRVAEAEETQYLQILKQAKAVADIVKVTDSLSNVRETIESIKGQIQLLDRQINYATITVYVREQSIAPITSEWQPLQNVIEAGRALFLTFKWLAVAGIWLIIYTLPLTAIFLTLYYLIYWIITKFR